MQTSDGSKETTVTTSPDEPTAPQRRHSALSRSGVDLWSAMGQHAGRAVAAGLLLGVLLAVIGAFAVLSGRTLYTSTTTMLIDDPYQLATSGQVSEFGNLDALRYKYSALVGTDAIAGPVARQLHLPIEDVLGAVSTTVPMNSLLMTVQATWTTAGGAQLISQAAANEVSAYIVNEDNTNNISSTYRFTFNVIDPATQAVGQGPSKSKAATLAIGLAVLGFAVGFLATQLIRYLRLP